MFLPNVITSFLKLNCGNNWNHLIQTFDELKWKNEKSKDIIASETILCFVIQIASIWLTNSTNIYLIWDVRLDYGKVND